MDQKKIISIEANFVAGHLNFCILSPDNETMHENRLKHNDIYLELFAQISYICTRDKIFRMFMFLLVAVSW